MTKQNNEFPIKSTLLGKISLSIAMILILILFNEFLQILPTHQSKLEGALLLSPILIAPIGAILGVIPLKKHKDTLAKWGVILNILLFLFPTFYNIFGTLLFGV